ncbi:hypothetical protein [Streptomyces sp. SS]|uniref:hypothetical protein n=1 Tax=Streptomyces sp. SS TaxID=260742 RepID=UPI0002F805F8|nr:hypothetical protein [Streptomyces sp. SS]
MSASRERPTLVPSLYAYAKGLRDAAPEAPLPRRGLPLPEHARPPRVPYDGPELPEAIAVVTDLLRPFLADPDPERAAAEVERLLTGTGITERVVFAAVDDIPPPAEPGACERARALARCLTRGGTSLAAVAAGLGLLSRLGEPEDVPYLRVLGLLQGLGLLVVRTLGPLDRKAAAVVWLVHRAGADALRGLVDALAGGDEATARDLLRELPTTPRELGPEHARRIAEAVALPRLLRRAPDHPGPLAPALFLLTRMCSGRGYEHEILAYDEAVALYETVAARAHELPPALDHRARLVSLALDLHSGAGHLLPWPPGRRRAVITALLAAVGEPGTPADREGRRRAEWIRRTAGRLREARHVAPSGAPRLRIEVAVADPGDPEAVETRFLVDGRPLVPAAFGRGPGGPPERLLDGGALRAGPEPKEVRLAEAYCTEGCCGALYVTVRREGAHVVWDGWHRPCTPPGLPPMPAALRFDADAYDTEVVRAERDLSWSWPARRTAWLISAGLRERPELLARWGLGRGWISTDFRAPDTTLVTFGGPPLTADGAPDTERPARQYLWYLPDDGTPPEEQAARALERLAESDPRGYPELRG